MQGMARTLIVIFVTAVVIFTTAYSVVTINENDTGTSPTPEPEEKFSGWGNYNILENVYPDYIPMSLKNNFYVAINDQSFRFGSTAIDSEQALEYINSTSAVANMTENIYEDLWNVLKNDPSLSGYYAVMSDQDSRDAVGIDAIESYITEIDDISTTEQLREFVKNGSSHLTSSFAKEEYTVGTGIIQIAVSHGNVPIVDDYGTQSSSEEEKNWIFYEFMLNKAGFDQTKINNYKDYLKEICDDLRDKIDSDYESYTYSEMNTKYSILGDDLDNYSSSTGLFRISDAEWMDVLEDYYKDPSKIMCFKSIAMYCLLMDSSSYLDTECYQKLSEVYEDNFNNTTVFQNDSLNTESFGWFMAKHYCSMYLSDEYTERMTELIYDIIDSAKEYYNSLAWMSQETKDNINLKFDNMKVYTIQPSKEQWTYMDYSSVDYHTFDSLYTYIANIRQCDENRLVSYSGQSESCLGGILLPQTPNASYLCLNNSISITAGISRAFIPDLDTASTEYMYGNIATIVGHEITHGFDSNGCNFDQNGELREGWMFSADDKITFEKKIDALKSYINGIECIRNDDGSIRYLNADLVIGEIMADMGGLAITEYMASKISDFDYEKYYRTYPETYHNVETKEEYLNYLDSDPHPSGMFRTNLILQQSQTFMDTFDVKEGDGMYLAADKRVAVWA